MPDANGGRGISLQCLNQFHGPQDATYLAEDLPAYIAQTLRVQPPGPAWGIAGYSEGGFCAANLGLKYGNHFGFSGVLSGYFVPSDNQLTNPPRMVSPFGGNAKLTRENTPDDLILSLPPGSRIPLFWLGVGSGDQSRHEERPDLRAAAADPAARCDAQVVPGGGHTHVHLAVADAVAAGVDDAAACPQRRRPAGTAGPEGPAGSPGRAAKRTKSSARRPRSPLRRTGASRPVGQSSSRTRTCSTVRWCRAARSARCRPSSR